MDMSTLRQQLRARLPDVIADLRDRVQANTDGQPDREAGFAVDTSDGLTVLRIYDEIWWLGVNAQDIADTLDDIETPQIRVELNSPGGDVFDGIAIYNALRNHPAEVVTRVDGVAASIASVIAQAGDRREVMASGQLMIHNAWGMTIGDTGDHEEMARILSQQDGIIAGIYASRSGRDVAGFRELMAAETWMDAERAVAEGLADTIIDPDNKPTTSNRTLNDEITAAMDVVEQVIGSAERVAALRADAGKSLSVVNCESLDGLASALSRLQTLTADTNEPDGLLTEQAANEFARFVALTRRITTS